MSDLAPYPKPQAHQALFPTKLIFYNYLYLIYPELFGYFCLCFYTEVVGAEIEFGPKSKNWRKRENFPFFFSPPLATTSVSLFYNIVRVRSS